VASKVLAPPTPPAVIAAAVVASILAILLNCLALVITSVLLTCSLVEAFNVVAVTAAAELPPITAPSIAPASMSTVASFAVPVTSKA